MNAKAEDLEAQLERNRSELAATIDQLTYRLDPRIKATEAMASAKQMVHDAGTDPTTTPEARNRARKVLGVGVGAVVAVVSALLARRR